MNKYIHKFYVFLRDKNRRFIQLSNRGFFDHWTDEKYLRYKFQAVFGYELDLKNPQTFNEKLQWLKLHDRNPLYTTLVDKYAVKKWVADKIGKQYIIPTLGVWDRFDEIDFDKLPVQFVLKTTHDSGGVVICHDKNTFDKQAARKKLEKSLKNNFYYMGREWPYKNVPPRIIAEPFLTDNIHTDLADYKFFCFHGVPRYCQVITDRSTSEKVDFFDMDWHHQPFTGLMKPFPPAKQVPSKPVNFDRMKYACSVLSKNIPFVRVDFYEVQDKMYLGEMTFYPASGFGSFSPKEWDKKIGDLLELPTEVKP